MQKLGARAFAFLLLAIGLQKTSASRHPREVIATAYSVAKPLFIVLRIEGIFSLNPLAPIAALSSATGLLRTTNSICA